MVYLKISQTKIRFLLKKKHHFQIPAVKLWGCINTNSLHIFCQVLDKLLSTSGSLLQLTDSVEYGLTDIQDTKWPWSIATTNMIQFGLINQASWFFLIFVEAN